MKTKTQLRFKSNRQVLITIQTNWDIRSLLRNIILIIITLNSVNAFSQNMNQNELNKKLYEENVAKTKLHEQQHLASSKENYFSEKKSSLASSLLSDSDDDGMPDTWETDNGLNPNDPFDVWEDPDNDFVLNLFEYQLNSDPFNASTPNIMTVSAGENIEDAIDETPTGSVLRVESGTYNVNYLTFDPTTIMIQGGWNSNFTSRDLIETPTIFDGQSLKEVLYFAFYSGSGNIIIDGLTLTQGKGSAGAFNFILFGSALSNLCIKDCKIINSQSTSVGGAVNIIHWDSSYSEVFIVNTLIANDSSSGIYNQTVDKGVGKWKIINSNITNNSSLNVKEGYGIDAFTLDSAALTIELINTILWGNQNSDLEISQSIIANAEYSNIGTVNTTIGAIYNEGTGIINADPLFVNPAGIEYNLKAGSPCISTGIDVGLPYAGIAPDMGLIFLGSQVSDQIVEIHNFGANNTQYYIYNFPGLIFEFKAQNTMMVGTVEVKSTLASPRAVTFHIEISIEDSLIAKWDQYVDDLTYKPYFHTNGVSYSLSEGDTIVYRIYGAGSPAGGLSGINYVKLISAHIPSNDATIHSTEHGILGDEEITMVDPTVSVTSFLDGITVHDSATIVMLDNSGGNEVSNPDMTDVVTGMVVKVTAEDGTPEEYAVSTDLTSISANHAERIVVYPIPACDYIIIQTPISEEFTINITSLNGKLRYSDKIEGPTHQIDLSSFQKGVYIITIRSKDFVTTKKIIKL